MLVIGNLRFDNTVTSKLNDSNKGIYCNRLYLLAHSHVLALSCLIKQPIKVNQYKKFTNLFVYNLQTYN